MCPVFFSQLHLAEQTVNRPARGWPSYRRPCIVRETENSNPSALWGLGLLKIRTLLAPCAENSNPLTSRVAVQPKFEPSWPPERKTRTLCRPGSRRTQNSNPPVCLALKTRTLLVPGMENLNPLTPRVACLLVRPAVGAGDGRITRIFRHECLRK